MKEKNVLITGGTGFIGSNLAHRLVALGSEVTILDSMSEPYGGNMFNIRGIEGKVKLIIKDIRDFDIIKKVIKNQDVIFHLAAQVGRTISMENPQLDIDINCNGMINILEACRKFNDNAKIVHGATRAQIGEPSYLPVNEDHPTNPTDIYGVNKLAAEKYLMIYNHVYGIPATSLRLTNVYGPRCQMRHGYYAVVNWFIGLAMRGKKIPVFGDGNQTRDYVYVDSVVDAMILAATRKESNSQIFFVGSGAETRFIDMVKMIIKIVGKAGYKYVPFPTILRKTDVRKFVVSHAKITKYLGWEPRIGLYEGIQRTVRFYEQFLQHYV